MRWPLKYQIAIPMAAVMLLGVAAASGLNAYLAASGTRSRIEEQLRDAASIVAATNFPLTESVLAQLRGLSGAHFVSVDAAGNPIASSTPELLLAADLPNQRVRSSQDLSLQDPIRVHGESYFHGRVAVGYPRRATGGGEGGVVHILYPVVEYEAAWQRAVFPSLAVVGVALPVAVLIAVATAARIIRRTARLQQQLGHIAEGDFAAAPVPTRNDELRDLAEGVNQMAAMLALSEEKVRKSERTQTLVQLGGGIAHQLRNSVTGCRMALDLHTEDCPLASSDESLRVARRQLELMAEYVRRFLQLGKADDGAGQFADVELGQVVNDVLPLVEPAAYHAGVRLSWTPPESAALVRADRTELSQLLINLVLNGIEAAGRPAMGNGESPQVRISIERAAASQWQLCVGDSGPGPAEHVHERIFEAFVSEKADGVGLGLSVVRTIAQQHGAELSWNRDDGWTRFVVEFPEKTAVPKGESACPSYS